MGIKKHEKSTTKGKLLDCLTTFTLTYKFLATLDNLKTMCFLVFLKLLYIFFLFLLFFQFHKSILGVCLTPQRLLGQKKNPLIHFSFTLFVMKGTLTSWIFPGAKSIFIATHSTSFIQRYILSKIED